MFFVKLTNVRNDAELNEESRFARVTVAPSDYIRGLIGFTEDSRFVQSCVNPYILIKSFISYDKAKFIIYVLFHNVRY